MKIFLKKNFETKFSIKTTVYFLKIRDRNLMNQIFDELHRKDRLQ